MDLATPILESLADPEHQATLAESGAFGVISGDAEPDLTDEQKKWNPTVKENLDVSIPMDQKYYAKNSDMVLNRYAEWVSG